MTYQLVFGSYSFPAPHTIAVTKIGMARVVPHAKLPRYDGVRTLSGMLDLKKFTLQGTIIRPLGNSTANYLRSVVDGLHGAMGQQAAQFAIDSDRFWRLCQAEAYSDDYTQNSFRNFVNVTLDIVTGDPFAYETAVQSGTRVLSATGQTLTVTPGGNAPAAGQIALTVGATGTLSATITNTTTGDICTLIGAVTSGDVITIDSLQETVTRAGVDVTSLFDGVFPRLAVGANVLQFAWTTSSLNNVTVTWQNRWL